MGSECRGSEQLPKEASLREVSFKVESQGPGASFPHGLRPWKQLFC